jgi:rsbT antagonist protein RsbS
MSDHGRIAVHEFEGSLVGSIQVELSERVMRAFRENLLEEIHRTGAESAIIDVSGLSVLDLHEFDFLRSTFRMASIMGCRSILVGLNPGIVAALIQLDADVEGLETALSVEHAIHALRPRPDASAEADDEDVEHGPPGEADEDSDAPATPAEHPFLAPRSGDDRSGDGNE